MSSYKKAQRSAWLVLTVAAAILVCTVLAPSAFGVPSPQDEEAAPKFKDIHTAIEAMYLVKAQFYKPVSVAELMKAYFAKGTVPGMLEVLNDP